MEEALVLTYFSSVQKVGSTRNVTGIALDVAHKRTWRGSRCMEPQSTGKLQQPTPESLQEEHQRSPCEMQKYAKVEEHCSSWQVDQDISEAGRALIVERKYV